MVYVKYPRITPMKQENNNICFSSQSWFRLHWFVICFADASTILSNIIVAIVQGAIQFHSTNSLMIRFRCVPLRLRSTINLFGANMHNTLMLWLKYFFFFFCQDNDLFINTLVLLLSRNIHESKLKCSNACMMFILVLLLLRLFCIYFWLLNVYHFLSRFDSIRIRWRYDVGGTGQLCKCKENPLRQSKTCEINSVHTYNSFDNASTVSMIRY